MRVFFFLSFLLMCSTLFAQGSRGETDIPVQTPPLPVSQTRVNDTSNIYDASAVDEVGEFPGGQQAFVNYIRKYTVYPEDARKANIQGKVYVSFVVEKDGSISNISVKKSVYPSLDAQAVRVILNCPKWTPANLNGQPVRMRMTVPFNFKL